MALRTKPTGILLPMRIWDGATRLFHWSLVLLMAVSYVSITLADDPYTVLAMRIHVLSGETMLAVLLFRIIWGFVGSETSRFGRFVRSPIAALRYLGTLFRREPDRAVGHNAAGGWMVMALLLLLLVQIGTGLGSNDDGLTEGPLVKFISHDASNLLSKIHGINFNILAAAAGLHVLVVVIYAVFKGQNLVRPMVTGKKRLPAATKAPRLANPWLAVVTAAIAIGLTVLVGRL